MEYIVKKGGKYNECEFLYVTCETILQPNYLPKYD